MCEGVVLLKQWKQGNTLFGKTIKGPIIRVFFYANSLLLFTFMYLSKDSL